MEFAAACAIPYEVAGEEVMVAAVPKSALATQALRPQELRDSCTGQLPDFTVPRCGEILNQLPMTPPGEAEKRKLRAPGGSRSHSSTPLAAAPTSGAS
ncbi:AMP-binding enzyme [Mycobacterium aquaticum]|uniref:AMP-binding enzyme C-terminal domain-containing protein n=1 Tax=Mycobacterium aquaticum TaxID=1927124 RepID=A0A1X0A8A3_9MYCO|nr:hypothetical protein BST13_32070 [Mycobacterium aquaticum]